MSSHPPFSMSIILEGFSFMARHPTVQAVWLGDFNITLNPSLDRLQPSISITGTARHTKFSKMISSFYLVDTWRHRFKHKHIPTFPPPITPSLGLILYRYHRDSRQGYWKLRSVPGLSDHRSYWITPSVLIDKPMRTWHLNPFWLSLLPEDDELMNEWKLYFAEANTPPFQRWSWIHSTIVLIPKLGKVPRYPESYCPISLLPVDNKILAKVLSIRLNQVILLF